MDQTQTQRGNFVAFLNRDKQPGDAKPTFDGRIAKPESEDELRVPLWRFEYTDKATGEVRIGFNGQAGAISTTAAPLDQINALSEKPVANHDIDVPGNIKLSPRQVVLFTNPHKSETSEKNRPDFYGYFNPGDGSPVVSISSWIQKDRYEHAMLTGATQYPVTGKSIDSQAPSLDETLQRGEVGRSMPKAKARAGRA